MKTMTTTGAAMTAAPVRDDVWYGANTAHSGDLGRVQGRSVSAAGMPVRERIAGLGSAAIADDFGAPTTGSVSHRLERPPV
jgi:hypothetical protein